MKEVVLKKYEELRRSFDDLNARILVVKGALGACEHFLQELEKAEKAADGDPDLLEHRNAGDESPADSDH